MLILISLAILAIGCTVLAIWAWKSGMTCGFVWISTLWFVAVALLCCLCVRSVEVARTADIEYQEAFDKRAALEFWVDFMEPDAPGQTEIKRQIMEFNKELELHKRYKEDPWRGLFWNEQIANLDYIKIPGE